MQVDLFQIRFKALGLSPAGSIPSATVVERTQ